MMAVWRILLESGNTAAGFTWPQMKAYLMVVFVAGALVSTHTEQRMAGRIRDGRVSIDLMHPVDYQGARLSDAVGACWIEGLAVLVVWGVTVVLSGPVMVPAPAQLALFCFSMVLVVLLKFLIGYITALACFWTENTIGVSWARQAVVATFSGALVPLAFYPGWFQFVCELLPFAGVASIPARLYIGDVHGSEALRSIGLQALWVALLWIGARGLWRRAARRLNVQGG